MADPRNFSRGRSAAGGWRFGVTEVIAAIGVFDAIQLADSLGEPRLAEDLERASRRGDLEQARELVAAVNLLFEEMVAEATAFQRYVAGDFVGNDYVDWDWEGLPEEGDGYYPRWNDDPAESSGPTPDDDSDAGPVYVVRFRQPFIPSGYEARRRSYRDDGQHGRDRRVDGRDRAIRLFRRSSSYPKR
jgi:hypothetical protein